SDPTPPAPPTLSLHDALPIFTRENVRLKQRGEPLLESLPPLVIAHPATDPARVACRAIAKRLELLKFHVTLRELPPGETRPNDRSEEHTSELQSRENLVCRLL